MLSSWPVFSSEKVKKLFFLDCLEKVLLSKMNRSFTETERHDNLIKYSHLYGADRQSPDQWFPLKQRTVLPAAPERLMFSHRSPVQPMGQTYTDFSSFYCIWFYKVLYMHFWASTCFYACVFLVPGLTAGELERTGVFVHWEIMKLQLAFCVDGHPGERERRLD